MWIYNIFPRDLLTKYPTYYLKNKQTITGKKIPEPYKNTNKRIADCQPLMSFKQKQITILRLTPPKLKGTFHQS